MPGQPSHIIICSMGLMIWDTDDTAIICPATCLIQTSTDVMPLHSVSACSTHICTWAAVSALSHTPWLLACLCHRPGGSWPRYLCHRPGSSWPLCLCHRPGGSWPRYLCHRPGSSWPRCLCHRPGSSWPALKRSACSGTSCCQRPARTCWRSRWGHSTLPAGGRRPPPGTA